MGEYSPTLFEVFMKKKELPAIYNFHDYREYLNEVFKILKLRKVSKRMFATKIEVSNAYITMVLNGKRNLDIGYIEKIGDYLKLSSSEKRYFENLCILSDSDNSSERNNAFKNLSKFNSYKVNSTPEVVTHTYLNHWYYVAIREMSFLEDFQEDVVWIQERLSAKLGQAEIKAALKFLNKNQLLKGQENKHFDCSEGIYKLALSKFHKEMLEQVSESIENVQRSKRSIMGFSKSMTKNNFKTAVKIMEKAIEDISNLEGNNKQNELYHFYFTGIPLTDKDN